jgi:hypothetical protein
MTIVTYFDKIFICDNRSSLAFLAIEPAYFNRLIKMAKENKTLHDADLCKLAEI